MGKAVSAAEANRNFSQLLRRVRDGGSYVITTHGRPVARIIPFTARDAVAAAAKTALLKRLRAQRGADIGRWTRDELYED
jgi:prevent-host-death family protein